MTEFYLVRHGETEINQRGEINGGLVDSPLTAKGRAGAARVGQALAQHRFVQVLSSPLPRALTTAQMIVAANADPHTPLQAANGLWEMRLGAWDGKRPDQIEDGLGREIYFHRPLEFDADYAPAIGAERYAEVEQRVVPVITTAAAAHPSGKILVVAHGLVFQVLVNALLGRPLALLRSLPILQNTTVTKLNTSDGKHFELIYRDRAPLAEK